MQALIAVHRADPLCGAVSDAGASDGVIQSDRLSGNIGAEILMGQERGL